MNCENYILLLDEYLNNELEEKLHGSVSNHLAICEDCRDEMRVLKLESGFYQNVETIQKRQFINQWDAMRNRLVAESLIRDKDLPAPEALKYQKNFLFLQTFFARLENLFLTNKTAFGVGLLIVFGIFSVFLLIGKNSLVEKKFEAAIEPKQSAEFEVSDYSTDHKSISSNKTTESAETKFTNQTEKNLLISRTAINDKSQFINRANKKFTKSKTNLLPPNKIIQDLNSVAHRLPAKTNGADFQSVTNDEKLAKYLNRVHLFLLLIRNLKNDDTINALIGGKYQIEARMFLNNNSACKIESLKSKNIPAAELLNEIEPVLLAISKLDNQNEKNNFVKVTELVKETGIVFKMRLWLANAKSVNENSL